MLEYEVKPEMTPQEVITVHDCNWSDVFRSGVSVGYSNIIGGADCVIVLTEGTGRAVCSSMYFEEKQEIEWYVNVQRLPFEPVKIVLNFKSEAGSENYD